LGAKHEESTHLAIDLKISQNKPKIASEIEILCFCPFGKKTKASSPIRGHANNAIPPRSKKVS
jgi:hypothetical protein